MCLVDKRLKFIGKKKACSILFENINSYFPI